MTSTQQPGLIDIEAIKRLKHRYLRAVDLKLWDEFEAVFTADGTADYDGMVFDSPGAAGAFMRANLGPRMITLHQCSHPEIDVDGDEAIGVWSLADKVLMPDHDLVLEGAGFYTDRYRRTPDGWRIAHTGYARTYEVTWPISAVPGWSLKIGSAFDAAVGSVTA